jgi:hypothetical protein
MARQLTQEQNRRVFPTTACQFVMKTWWLWHPCGGVDYDPAGQVLYFGTTDTREIYRIDIKADSNPESLSQLPQMQKMGPIALDSAAKILYIGDIAGGVLFEFDLSNHSARTLISGLGTVAALYTDPNSRSLYIVDSVARTVLCQTWPTRFQPTTRPHPRQVAEANPERHVRKNNDTSCYPRSRTQKPQRNRSARQRPLFGLRLWSQCSVPDLCQGCGELAFPIVSIAARGHRPCRDGSCALC